MYPINPSANGFTPLCSRYAYRPGGRFAGLFSPDFFQAIADAHSTRFGRTFDAAVILYGWLGQSAGPDKTCMAAVLRIMSVCLLLGRAACSPNTGAFCKARAKLPESFVRELAVTLGERVETFAPDDWLYQGHRVLIADGTLVRMPDTPENLQQYPQQSHQKPGTSATCMRVVLLLALATGMLMDASYGPYSGKGYGEMSLLRNLFGGVRKGDLLLGDRYYGSYHLLHSLRVVGADGCFRLSVGRQKYFGEGQAIGDDEYDRLQVWMKPCRPKGVAAEEWALVPERITVRVLRYSTRVRGFRCKEVYLVTTLTDAQVYTKDDLAGLYRQRWNVELDIKSLKRTLGLHESACKTPELVRVDLWVHLLHYNLTRCAMAQAAWDKGWQPRQLSFATATKVLRELGDGLMRGEVDERTLTKALTAVKVGNRPDRYEPREVKRKPRKYKELTKSRAKRRAELATEQEEPQGRKGGGKNRATGR